MSFNASLVSFEPSQLIEIKKWLEMVSFISDVKTSPMLQVNEFQLSPNTEMALFTQPSLYFSDLC